MLNLFLDLNALTREQNINIPELADLLIERTKQTKWVVVFKSLITTHHLMCYGNEVGHCFNKLHICIKVNKAI